MNSAQKARERLAISQLIGCKSGLFCPNDGIQEIVKEKFLESPAQIYTEEMLDDYERIFPT